MELSSLINKICFRCKRQFNNFQKKNLARESSVFISISRANYISFALDQDDRLHHLNYRSGQRTPTPRFPMCISRRTFLQNLSPSQKKNKNFSIKLGDKTKSFLIIVKLSQNLVHSTKLCIPCILDTFFMLISLIS